MCRASQHSIDLVGSGQGSLAIQRAIHRADGFLCSGHNFPKVATGGKSRAESGDFADGHMISK
jgi:hypothetical protein